MSRIILLILIGLIANWWWRNQQRQRMSQSRSQQAGAARPKGAPAGGASDTRTRGASPFSRRAAPAALPEPMVRCAFCDTHLPVSEATASGGLHFCHPRHAHDYAVRVAQSGDGR
ncbi:MAG TPA: PP0621 family protein [Pararobbsia sp.]|nr:PP0621 family protein [Pararobbsia sp.]